MPLSCGSTSRRCSRRAGWSPGCTTRGSRRREVVVELAVDPARFRTPQSIDGEPWTPHAADRAVVRPPPLPDVGEHLRRPRRRAGVVVGVKAARLADGAVVVAPSPDAPGRRRAWPTAGRCGSTAGRGARRPPAEAAACTAESVELGVRCAVVPPRGRAGTPTSPPTSSPRSPTTPAPARVIAPAGSGKTRVLTERLRHLHRRPRRTSRRPCSPSPTTSRPSWRWSRAPPTFRPARAHAQLARAVGARRAPRRLAARARRARGAAAGRVAAARPRASGGPTPTRSARTSRG